MLVPGTHRTGQAGLSSLPRAVSFCCWVRRWRPPGRSPTLRTPAAHPWAVRTWSVAVLGFSVPDRDHGEWVAEPQFRRADYAGPLSNRTEHDSERGDRPGFEAGPGVPGHHGLPGLPGVDRVERVPHRREPQSRAGKVVGAVSRPGGQHRGAPLSRPPGAAVPARSSLIVHAGPGRAADRTATAGSAGGPRPAPYRDHRRQTAPRLPGPQGRPRPAPPAARPGHWRRAQPRRLPPQWRR